MQNKIISVFVDFDGTISDVFPVWSKWHDECCGCCSLMSLSEPWEADNKLKCRNRIFEFFYGPPSPYAEVIPIKDSVNSLDYLRENGYDVWIASESHPKISNFIYHYKLSWISEWIGETWKNKFVFVPSKHILRGDILIDDRPSVLENWKKKTGKEGLLLAQPWNMKSEKRFNSWKEIVACLTNSKVSQEKLND